MTRGADETVPPDPERAHVVDASFFVVPIESAAGPALGAVAGPAAWQPVAAGEAERAPQLPLMVGDLLDEAHHRLYRQPWIAGRFRFDDLVRLGLGPEHRVLDFGCGAGRVGIHVIRYLAAGRYCGVDGHLRALAAFSAYELRLAALADKAPRLLHDDDFRFDAFGPPRFDAVLDVASSRHLPRERARQAYRRMVEVLAPGGRIYAGRFRVEYLDDVLALGLVLERFEEVDYPFGLGHGRRAYSSDWHVFTRAASR